MIEKFKDGETLADYRIKRRNCRLCGRPCMSRDSKVYCSRKCAFAMTHRLAKQRQALRRTRCVRCGTLSGGDNRGRVRATKYCSRACECAARKERSLHRRERHTRACPQCLTRFIPRQNGGGAWRKCCSLRCAAEFRRKDKFVELPCSACGAICRKVASQVKRCKRIACSLECWRAVRRGANHPLFRAESILDPKRRKATGRWKRVSAAARERDGHACLRCRRVREPHQRRFPVDHIIPWRTFEDKALADDLSNLATLCPTCHSWKTNTVEAQYLKGDVLGMVQYRLAISLP